MMTGFARAIHRLGVRAALPLQRDPIGMARVAAACAAAYSHCRGGRPTYWVISDATQSWVVNEFTNPLGDIILGW